MRTRLVLVLVLVLAVVLNLGPGYGGQPASAQSGPRGYLIGSAAPLTAAQVQALQNAGATVKQVYRNFGGAAASIADRATLARVQGLPFVTSVTEDGVKQLHEVYVEAPAGGTPAAGRAGAATGTLSSYWLDLIDAEKNTTYTGSGVWVAVLDSGFYPNWRDYFDPSSILTQYAAAFISVLGNPNENQWDVGSDPHGLAVAANIVGYWFRDREVEGGFGSGFVTGQAGTYWVPGIAPGAKIIPIKVCEPLGCYDSAIIGGIDHVTSLKKANPDQPIVINESLGGPSLGPVEKAAIDAAIAAGVVMVASAGNEGTAGMGYPAAYEPVISVGAGGWRGQWVGWPSKSWYDNDVPETGVSLVYVTGFSSRQKPGQYLDVVSTGRYLLLPYPCAQLYKDGQVTNATLNRTCASKATPDSASAAPYQYLFISGTSFSGPTVAGIVALMLEKNPGLTSAGATATRPGQVEAILEGAATPIPAGTATVVHRDGSTLTETWSDDATGKGWIFVDRALAATPRQR